MPATSPFQSRPLTTADTLSVMALVAEAPRTDDVYDAVGRIAKACCGWRLLTVLKYVEADGAVERLWSSDPGSYPVGGRKPLDKLNATQSKMARGEVALAATKDDVRREFFDHELIFSLGITAILNVPIRYQGRRLGNLNFCGEEGMYGPREVEAAKALGGLLVPPLLEAMRG